MDNDASIFNWSSHVPEISDSDNDDFLNSEDFFLPKKKADEETVEDRKTDAKIWKRFESIVTCRHGEALFEQATLEELPDLEKEATETVIHEEWRNSEDEESSLPIPKISLWCHLKILKDSCSCCVQDMTLSSSGYNGNQQLSRFEMTLFNVPPDMLSRKLSFYLTSFQPTAITNHRAFINYLLKTIVVNPHIPSVISATRTLQHVLRCDIQDFCSSISILDLYDAFINFGVDVSVYCPVPRFFEYFCRKSRQECTGPHKVDSTLSDRVFNFNSALQALSTLIIISPFSNSDLSDIICLLLWISLDVQLQCNNTVQLIQSCISEIISKIPPFERQSVIDTMIRFGKYECSVPDHIRPSLLLHVIHRLPVKSPEEREFQKMAAFMASHSLLRILGIGPVSTPGFNVESLLELIQLLILNSSKLIENLSDGLLKKLMYLVDYSIGYELDDNSKSSYKEFYELLISCGNRIFNKDGDGIKVITGRIAFRISQLLPSNLFETKQLKLSNVDSVAVPRKPLRALAYSSSEDSLVLSENESMPSEKSDSEGPISDIGSQSLFDDMEMDSAWDPAKPASLDEDMRRVSADLHRKCSLDDQALFTKSQSNNSNAEVSTKNECHHGRSLVEERCSPKKVLSRDGSERQPDPVLNVCRQEDDLSPVSCIPTNKSIQRTPAALLTQSVSSAFRTVDKEIRTSPEKSGDASQQKSLKAQKSCHVTIERRLSAEQTSGSGNDSNSISFTQSENPPHNAVENPALSVQMNEFQKDVFSKQENKWRLARSNKKDIQINSNQFTAVVKNNPMQPAVISPHMGNKENCHLRKDLNVRNKVPFSEEHRKAKSLIETSDKDESQSHEVQCVNKINETIPTHFPRYIPLNGFTENSGGESLLRVRTNQVASSNYSELSQKSAVSQHQTHSDAEISHNQISSQSFKKKKAKKIKKHHYVEPTGMQKDNGARSLEIQSIAQVPELHSTSSSLPLNRTNDSNTGQCSNYLATDPTGYDGCYEKTKIFYGNPHSLVSSETNSASNDKYNGGPPLDSNVTVPSSPQIFNVIEEQSAKSGESAHVRKQPRSHVRKRWLKKPSPGSSMVYWNNLIVKELKNESIPYSNASRSLSNASSYHHTTKTHHSHKNNDVYLARGSALTHRATPAVSDLQEGRTSAPIHYRQKAIGDKHLQRNSLPLPNGAITSTPKRKIALSTRELLSYSEPKQRRVNHVLPLQQTLHGHSRTNNSTSYPSFNAAVRSGASSNDSIRQPASSRYGTPPCQYPRTGSENSTRAKWTSSIAAVRNSPVCNAKKSFPLVTLCDSDDDCVFVGEKKLPIEIDLTN